MRRLVTFLLALMLLWPPWATALELAVGFGTGGAYSGGIIPLALGGTNADLSATGGNSNVLRQNSAGATITVSQLAASDLTNGVSGSGAVALVNLPIFTSGAVFGVGTHNLFIDMDSNTSLDVGATLYSTDTSQPTWRLRKSRGTFASPTTIVNGDYLASLVFYANTSSSPTWVAGGQIDVKSNGTVASGNAPSDMIFSTAGASGNAAERLRITSGGLLTFAGTSASFPAWKRSSTTLQARLADDSGYATLDAVAYKVSGTAIAASDLSNGVSGSGAVCLVTSCTMVTPTLGVAAATSLTTTGAIAGGTTLSVGSATGSNLANFISNSNVTVALDYYKSDNDRSFIFFRHARGTAASPATVVDGDFAGTFVFYARGSTAFQPLAQIDVLVNGVSGDTLGGDMTFRTGAFSSVNERLRINAGGNVLILDLKTTGAATGKKVVCVDTSTGQLYASSAGNSCAN